MGRLFRVPRKAALMAVFAITSCTILGGTAWTGTAPGGSATPSGTITTGVDYSALFTQVELSIEAEELDFTNFASAGWRQKITGLQMGTVSLTLNDSYAAANTDAVFGLGGTLGIGSTSPLYLDIKPTGAARSATNPSMVLRFLNTGGKVTGGTVGELPTRSLTFPTTGVVARLTS
jgi:uncharacterized protein YwbE